MIAWREDMGLGIEGLDEEHKALVNLINDFDRCKSRKSAYHVAQSVLAQTKQYFQREEELQAAFAYTNLPLHHSDHDRIVKEMDILITGAFLDHRLNDHAAILMMSEWMRDLFIGHMLVHDLKLRQAVLAGEANHTPFMPPHIASEASSQLSAAL